MGLACPPSQARPCSLRFSGARRAGHVLSWLSASTSGFAVASSNRISHRRGQLQATLVARHPVPPLRGGAARRKQPSGVHAVRLSSTSARGEQWPPNVARCKAQPLAQAERQRQPTRPGPWCRSILHSPGLACYRCLPLSSHVGPRMPTLTGTSPFFETQGRAPRGTSAFTTFQAV